MGKITKESVRRFFSKPSSYALLFAVNTALASGHGEAAGYRGGLVTAIVVVALALAASFLIPSPASVNKAEPAAKD